MLVGAILGVVNSGLGFVTEIQKEKNIKTQYGLEFERIRLVHSVDQSKYLMSNKNEIFKKAKERYLFDLTNEVAPVFVKNLFIYIFIFILIYLFIMPVFNPKEDDGRTYK